MTREGAMTDSEGKAVTRSATDPKRDRAELLREIREGQRQFDAGDTVSHAALADEVQGWWPDAARPTDPAEDAE